MLAILPPRAQQPLDTSCVATINGRAVRVSKDGTFTIRNIPADGALHAVQVICAGSGQTWYGRTEHLLLVPGTSYRLLDEIGLRSSPFPSVVALRVTTTAPILTSLGQQTQLLVIVDLSDGANGVPRPLRSQGTSYVSSNTTVVMVDQDGLVTARGRGTAFVTVRNEGRTATTEIEVVPGGLFTEITGFVERADGSPVANTAVTVVGTALAGQTGADGSFALPGAFLRSPAPIVVGARLAGSPVLTGASNPIAPLPNGFTDAGRIVIGSGDLAVALARPGASGCPQTGRLDLIDAAGVQASLPLGGDALDVATSRDGSTAVVTDFCGQSLIVVSLGSPPTVRARIPLPIRPVDVVLTDRGYAIVTGLQSVRSVVSVDVVRLAVVHELGLPVPATAVAVTADGTTALVASYATDEVRRIDVTPSGVLVDSGRSIPSGGAAPINIAISPDGTRALVAHVQSPALGVVAIEPGGLRSLGSVTLAATAQSIAFHPDGSRAFALLEARGEVRTLSIDANGSVTNTGPSITGLPTQAGLDYVGVDKLALRSEGQRLLVNLPIGIGLVDLATNLFGGTIPLAANQGTAGVAAIGR
jgi:hypothetical protein